jgi:hypothetical protein
MEENQKEENQETQTEAIPETDKTQESSKDMMMNKYLWVVGLLVVLGLGYYLIKGRTPAPVTTEVTTEETTTVPEEKNLVLVSDYTAGKTATVASVLLENPGYVMIHEDVSGKPGAIIGTSALLPAKESLDVVVNLKRASKEGEVLYAMLHTDDGDGKFNETGDTPLTDSSGNTVMTSFTVEAGE